MNNQIPKVAIGSIGGSGTWGAKFPEDFSQAGVKCQQYLGPIKTPYGPSAPFKLIEIARELVLRVAMHGWHKDEHGQPVPASVAAAQVAWIFKEAGVQWAYVDGSVGGIQKPDKPGEPLPPWSVTITHDYIQHWVAADQVTLPRVDGHYRRMREPFCTGLRKHLLASAKKQDRFTVYNAGVYVCTPTGRFETAAEIAMLGSWGGHVVGQTLGHEAPLMRKLGIHFASLNIVSNFAEGHSDWVGGNRPEAMADFYRECAQPTGKALLDAYGSVIKNGIGPCACGNFNLAGLEVFPVAGA